jgi:hypothetical protein
MATFQDLFLPIKVYKYLTTPTNSVEINKEELIAIHSCSSKWNDFSKCISNNESKNCQHLKTEFENCVKQLN